MKRYTRKIDDGKYEITDLTKATESLAKFEDLYDYAIGAYGMHTSYGLARS